ncbi:NHL repeat-containing protein [Gluconobacter morbifer]|uniref:Uncharacterized protein n=1 Tax=Gluconobacter morbifer G707 TaxID=1088869 RepID=G6XGG1_9PROT|nr:hypothetical protein [Gluconobacter morbifer]EHH69269.1 hypothetical protein GMO_05760 [Gluconobacter morbifer G707]
MKSRFLSSIAVTTALAVCALSSPARADHPWQDVSSPAHVVQDSPVASVGSTVLLAMGDGRFLALDPQGHPVQIDSENVAHPFGSDAPGKLVALTRDDADIWGLTDSDQLSLVHFSAQGNVVGTVPLKDATIAGSHLVALQVSRGHAYLVDEAKPALVVANLSDGKSKRFLGYDASLTGRRPLLRDGKISYGPDGRPQAGGNVRFLALDNKGQWLFYQPACGPLYRIDTALLTDPNFTPVEQLDGIVEWRDTPGLGGLTLSPDNVFYMSDITEGALLKFGADRIPQRLMRDRRMIDAGALAVAPNRQIAVLTDENGTTHILRIALP